MREYEYIFAIALQSKLKEKIDASIYVNVFRDQLTVHIKTRLGLEYETGIDNFSEKIRNGYSSEYAAYQIVKEYRSYINRTFFY